MSENAIYDYSSTCSALREAIQNLDVRIRMSEQNTKLRDTYSGKLDNLERNVELCNGVTNIMKPELADIKEYIARRRKESMQNINNALRLSGEIIPDSSDGIFFQIESDGSAWLSTTDGLSVAKVEGSGYCQVSSTFVRSTVLSANSGILHTLLLDEIFSQVSQDNSTTLSLYLNVLCQNMQIISIEQKPQVYSNLDHVLYVFEKGEYSSVTRKEIRR